MPIVSFWSEWWAGALGMVAALAGLIALRGRSLILPQVLVVPAALLAMLLLQFGLGRLAFPQMGLLYAVYLLWAALLMVLGRHLVETAGFVRFADVIASALVLGALIGAGIALAQWLGVSVGRGWIFPKLSSAVYANLGQANHHAHYSWLGIASAFYLRGRHYLSRPLLWLLILLIAFGSVLSGSRSVFVYPVVLLAAIGWWKFREPRRQAACLFVDVALLLPVVIALSIVGTWATSQLPELSAWLCMTQSTGSGPVMAGSRLYESVSGTNARFEIARSAWSAFVEYPWLGQGVGNYTWANFVAASSRAGDDPYAVAENAHNFILQLMAEFGAPATGLVILALGLWARRFLGNSWRLEQFWCAAVLGIGLVHALLEYPLWYAYFLGPTALLLGAADSRGTATFAGRRGAIYLFLAALMGALILGNLRSDYSKIEAVANYPLKAHLDRERALRISMDHLLKLHHESLLSPWALSAITTMAEPSRQQAQDRADLCERGIRFSPARSLVTRCAMQLAIAGRMPEAEKLALDVLRAYPSQRDTTVDELAKGALAYPEIAPLWRASQSK